MKEKERRSLPVEIPPKVESFLARSNLLGRVHSEFLEVAPGDAVHCLMGVEVFLHLFDNSTTIKSMSIEKQKWYGEVGMAGMLFHDIGKAGVANTMEEALAITQHVPEDFGSHLSVKQALGRSDKRKDWQKAAHRLHPLASEEIIREISRRESDGGVKKLLQEASVLAGSHHELHVAQDLYDFAGRPISSYPKSEMLHGKGEWGYLMLLVKMADVIVAMGRPRSFRDWNFDDGAIMHELSNVSSDKTMDQIYGPKKNGFLWEKFRLILSAFDGLDQIRKKYSNEICVGKSRAVFSQMQLVISRENGFLLEDVVFSSWEKVRNRGDAYIESRLKGI